MRLLRPRWHAWYWVWGVLLEFGAEGWRATPPAQPQHYTRSRIFKNMQL